MFEKSTSDARPDEPIHRCANGPGKCRATTLDNQGNKHAAETPNTLCHACLDTIRWAIGDLPETWIALHQAIGDHTKQTAPKVAGSRNPPINLNTDVDALKTDIAEWLTLAATRLSDTLNIDDPHPRSNTDPEQARIVDECTRIVEPHIHTLADMPAEDAHIWLPPGQTDYPGERTVNHDGITHHGTTITPLTGLQILQHLTQLRSRARKLLALNTPRDRLNIPCPGCNQKELTRRHEKPAGRKEVDQIDCGNCGLSWPYDRYRQLCMIWLKEDEMERDKLQKQLTAAQHQQALAEWLLAEKHWQFGLALDCPNISAAEFATTVLESTT